MTESAGPVLLTIAVEPSSTDDSQRLRQALQQLAADDPTLSVQLDSETGRVLIGGMGELHLEIVTDRLRRDFNIQATIGRPQVAYKETLTRPADGEMKYAKQSGGRGHYAHARVRVSPGDRGTGYVFVNATIGDAIRAEFIPSIDEGIREALAHGILAGYPTEDVMVELYDGSFHDVDSSPLAFKLAGALAYRDAAAKAQPVLLEPIVRIEVTAPPDQQEAVLNDLTRRRAEMLPRDAADGQRLIVALVPLSQLSGYAADLGARSSGRATYTMRFARYQAVSVDEGDDDRDSLVGAPRRPAPPLRNSSVARPEADMERQGE